MQYQPKPSSRCRYSCSSSSPPCSCQYYYCQPNRNSNSSHYSHYPQTTVHHHYHYLPHSSSSSSSSPQTFYCQQCCRNMPTCMAFSPTKHHQSCHYQPSNTSVSSNPVAPNSPNTFANHRHQQHERIDPKKYKLLTHSIQELIQSERDYVDDLYIMVEICLAVLHKQKWASARHVAIMSRNSSDILAFHRRVLASLNTSAHQSIDLKCQIVSQTFLDHRSEFMALYVDYCDEHSKAWSLCTEYRSKSEWPDFILQCQSLIQKHRENKSLSLSAANKRIRFEDFLIKPIQRICRYQLLLKEVLRYANLPSTSAITPSSSNAPSYHSLLTEAFHCMHHIATEIDRQNEKKEYQERTNRFIQRLESDWRLSRHGVAQLGPLLISGALDVQYFSNNRDRPHPLVTEDSPHPHELTSSPPPSFPSPPPSPINTAMASNNNTTVKSRYLGCFVFSSYIIMVQVKKQTLYEAKHWFPLHIIDLIDQDNDNEFTIQCHQHIFLCTASCLREKQTWIEKIRAAQQSVYQQQQGPINLVSSLISHPFSSTQLTANHHQPLLRSSTAFFSNEHPTYQYHARRSFKTDSLPASSSSPSLLLAMADEHGHYTKLKKNRSLSTHLTSSSSATQNIDSSPSSPSSPTFQLPSTATNPSGAQEASPPPRRHSSLDLFSMATHNLNRVSLHFKAQHRNAIRDAVDQRLRDVCTRDYLSSRARHLALNRKSSTTLAPPPSTATATSPLITATSPGSFLSPSSSPSTPMPTTAASSGVSSPSLVATTPLPFHQYMPSTPTPYQLAPSSSMVHPTSPPCRQGRSNPKSSHEDSRKTSSTTMNELSPSSHITPKKGHRRVSRLLHSLWHRLSRRTKKKHVSTMTKTEMPPHQPPHQSTVSLPTTSAPLSSVAYPMKIREENENDFPGNARPSLPPITRHSDFHFYRSSYDI